MAGTRHTRAATRKHSCTRKRALTDRSQADRYRLYRISQGAAPWTVEVYRCRRFCGLWHVGHRPDPRSIHRH